VRLFLTQESTMKYKIIGDSSLDMNEELLKRLQASCAPLRISVGEDHFLDDGTLNLKAFMDIVASSNQVVKTAAPSPSDFLQYMSEEYDGVFIITLSSKLSASYSSALIARDLAKEAYPELKVHVVDSLAASAGQTTIAIRIQECIDKGMDFEEIVREAEAFRDNDQLYFLLDNIDTLMKNGRMSRLKGLVAQLLHIKPILGDNGQGEIELFDKARTYSKALEKLAEKIYSTALDTSNRVLVIAQCFAQERAEELKRMVSENRQFQDIIIVPMKALSSVYPMSANGVCFLIYRICLYREYLVALI
jgi:DegV family protein with EDD domain